MTKEEFYNGKVEGGELSEVGHRRRLSRELDFGVWWRKKYAYPNYRITWVEATGELISVNLAPGISDYEVIGRCKGEDNIEKLLEGWAEKCGPTNSWYWIAEKFNDRYKNLYIL